MRSRVQLYVSKYFQQAHPHPSFVYYSAILAVIASAYEVRKISTVKQFMQTFFERVEKLTIEELNLNSRADQQVLPVMLESFVHICQPEDPTFGVVYLHIILKMFSSSNLQQRLFAITQLTSWGRNNIKELGYHLSGQTYITFLNKNRVFELLFERLDERCLAQVCLPIFVVVAIKAATSPKHCNLFFVKNLRSFLQNE